MQKLGNWEVQICRCTRQGLEVIPWSVNKCKEGEKHFCHTWNCGADPKRPCNFVEAVSEFLKSKVHENAIRSGTLKKMLLNTCKSK